MFFPRTRIRVRVKLFTGLHREAGLKGYDPEAGIEVVVHKGARIRTVAKQLRLPGGGRVAFFVAGQSVGPWHKLRDGDEVAFVKPSAGG